MEYIVSNWRMNENFIKLIIKYAHRYLKYDTIQRFSKVGNQCHD
jgi:hypothetical protein